MIIKFSTILDLGSNILYKKVSTSLYVRVIRNVKCSGLIGVLNFFGINVRGEPCK